MDLTHSTLPGAVGDLHYGIGAFTGWDWLASLFLSQKQFQLYVARKILRSLLDRATPEAVYARRVTFTIPPGGGALEIVMVRRVTGVEGGRIIADPPAVAAVVPWQGRNPS
jgi:hypothetical protein